MSNDIDCEQSSRARQLDDVREQDSPRREGLGDELGNLEDGAQGGYGSKCDVGGLPSVSNPVSVESPFRAPADIRLKRDDSLHEFQLADFTSVLPFSEVLDRVP